MCLVVGLLLTYRLVRIQFRSEEYRKQAARIVSNEQIITPARGLIYDRNGELIVRTQVAYDIYVTPNKIEAFDTAMLLEHLDISKEYLLSVLRRARRTSQYRPSLFLSQVSWTTYALLHEQVYRFPGFSFRKRPVRDYRYASIAPVVGYVGEVTTSLLKSDPWYKLGDNVGQTGLERSYEEMLRGEKGRKWQLVDPLQRIQGTYRKGDYDRFAKRGQKLMTTIDIELQNLAMKLLKGKKGSIVAIEPETGEILCMTSSPSYDPNNLVGRNRNKSFPLLSTDSLKPLFNRALLGVYPPGSTIKPFNALIALQERCLSLHTSYLCQRGVQFRNLTVGCHHFWQIGLRESISGSCNAYYSLVFKGMIDNHPSLTPRESYIRWRKMLLSFGFGITYPQSDVGLHRAGNIPTASWYDKQAFGRSSNWWALRIVSLAIGQGHFLATPLQLANGAAALANRGYWIIPHLVRLEKMQWQKHYCDVDAKHFPPVIDAMEGTMKHPDGTAYWSRSPYISICGKTGTVQVSRNQVDHSVFIGFAPKDKPQIALCVFIENGGWGSHYAAPIARLMLEKYLLKKIPPLSLSIAQRMMDSDLINNPGKRNEKR